MAWKKIVEWFAKILSPSVQKKRNEMQKLLCDILEMDEDELNVFLESMKQQEIKYLICIDMGCGGTSAAVIKFAEKGIIKPVVWRYCDGYDANGKKKQTSKNYIPTIMGYNGNEIVIGPEALMYGRAAENFKKIPTTENLKSVALKLLDCTGKEYAKNLSEVWGDYFKGILEYILKEIRGEFEDCTKENSLLAVAHPASTEWTEEKILTNYKNLICKGTQMPPEQVLTISEAKAAMQYIKFLHNMPIDWTKGIMIIDLGASTVDIEYLSQKYPNPKEWSMTMAGKEIDRILAYYILCEEFPVYKKRFPTMDDFLQDDEFWQDENAFESVVGMSSSEFMFDIRNRKEEICNNGQEITTYYEQKKPFSFIAAIPSGKISTANLVSLEELIDNNEFSFPCQDPKLAMYMNQENIGTGIKNFQLVKGSWYSHLEKLVCFALDELQMENYNVSNVIVTGGTSQLVGIQKHIEKAIAASTMNGNSNITITMLSNPDDYERTVPYGSCYYIGDTVKHVDTMVNFPNMLQRALDIEIKTNRKLTKYIADSVSELVVDAVEKSLSEWADAPKNTKQASLDGLDTILNEHMKNISEQKLEEKVDNGISKFHADRVKALESVYDETNTFLNSLLSQKEDKKYQLDVTKIMITLDTKSIISAVQGRLKKMDFGSLQNVGGTIANAWAKFKNVWNDYSEKDMPRPASYRKNVRDSISRNTIYPDIEDIIHTTVVDAYRTNDRFDLENQIIRYISDDIKRALYLS